MPNVNVIATPNIKGDISSCHTDVTYLNNSSRDSLWTVNDTGYATNNCTGKTDVFYSWEISGLGVGGLILCGTLIAIVFFIAMINLMEGGYGY